MSSTEIVSPDYSDYRELLLKLAQDAIRYGLRHHAAPEIAVNDFPAPLRENRACFVTLQKAGELRGCIGSLEAYRPLVVDLVNNAYAAAFADPRFPPVNASELDALRFHISILNPPQPMSFASQSDLIQQLRPGIDGLILQADGRRGTFLPSVWESLPEPAEFLRHLKYKAGLPPDYWSDSVRVWRYTAESIE